VFHLAALIGIPYSTIAPTSYVDVNVNGTLNVLEAARASALERVVITSTSEVYGTARFTPITEQHPLQPQSPYAASKVGADSLALSYHHSFGLPVTIVRPFNTYGPRQSSRAILPTIITQALASDAVRVGNRLPIRDLMHVKDTVAGFLASGFSEQCLGQIINLATGVGVQVDELIRLVTAQVGRCLPILEEETRKRPESSEVHQLIGSWEKAAKLVGWHPRISLDDGLAQTISWFRGRNDKCDPASYRV
jgi:dTDP-glucose 4,6-dehydratase